MNMDRIKKLRDYIDRGIRPEQFRMDHWVGIPDPGEPGEYNDALSLEELSVDQIREGSCGTVACLAGHTVALFSEPGEKLHAVNISTLATDFLDLREEEAQALFLPVQFMDVTNPKHAVAVLDHLIQTGEIEWDVVF